MRELFEEKIEVNLPYFLLTSLEQCYLKGTLGFSLMLTKLFQYVDCPLDAGKGKMVCMTTLYRQIFRPPKSLLVFGIEENKEFLSENMIGQLKILDETQLLMLQNQ